MATWLLGGWMVDAAGCGDEFAADDPPSGRVRLTFTGVLRVPATDPLTYETWRMQVSCPQCGASADISVEARDHDTVAICPREDCGRAWPAGHIATASQIRQMHHLRECGQEVRWLHPHQVEVSLVPDLEDDVRLAEDPLADADGSLDPVTRWSLGVASRGQHAPPLAEALGWARGMLAVSMPSDGELYARLYPAAGGSALDAHMVQLVLGLAIYQTAYEQGVAEFSQVGLDAVAEQLDGDAEQLRGLRPAGLGGVGGVGGRLRRSDIDRLEHCTDTQWARWRHLAGEVVAEHCRLTLRNWSMKGTTLPLSERVRPWPGGLGRCRWRFPRTTIDVTWYQGG